MTFSFARPSWKLQSHCIFSIIKHSMKEQNIPIFISGSTTWKQNFQMLYVLECLTRYLLPLNKIIVNFTYINSAVFGINQAFKYTLTYSDLFLMRRTKEFGLTNTILNTNVLLRKFKLPCRGRFSLSLIVSCYKKVYFVKYVFQA